ncbi:MAG: hypothetical protein Q8M15_06215 [Bacteroidota bacterium]|nr:hypothetical protein [Bacteroidota bacterium]
MKKNTTIKNSIISFILLLAVTLPRFNGNQIIVKQVSYDAKYFESYIHYFRGEPLTQPLRPASNWRMLTPFVASWLPFSPATSINLLNLFFLMAALFVFYKTLAHLNIQTSKIWQSLWLFILSFPTFYYSCISYVEPGVIFFISMGIYAVLKENIWLFYVSVLLGLLVKETIVLLFPFSLTYYWVKQQKKIVLYHMFAFILIVFEYILIRKLAPVSEGVSADVFWKASFNSVQTNLYRIHTWLSFILSFGLVGFLFVKSLLHHPLTEIKTNSLVLASIAGILGAMLLYLISYFTTIADGRIIWQSYFFLLIIINQKKQEV